MRMTWFDYIAATVCLMIASAAIASNYTSKQCAADYLPAYQSTLRN